MTSRKTTTWLVICIIIYLFAWIVEGLEKRKRSKQMNVEPLPTPILSHSSVTLRVDPSNSGCVMYGNVVYIPSGTYIVDGETISVRTTIVCPEGKLTKHKKAR